MGKRCQFQRIEHPENEGSYELIFFLVGALLFLPDFWFFFVVRIVGYTGYPTIMTAALQK